jgi:hypothetical protein
MTPAHRKATTKCHWNPSPMLPRYAPRLNPPTWNINLMDFNDRGQALSSIGRHTNEF